MGGDKGMDKSENDRKAPVKSSTLKLGRQIIFFDVNVAKNSRKYLKISESHYIGDNGETKRSTFVLFPDQLKDFQSRLNEIATEVA